MADTPHDFSLRQLQYFVAVAETLSFRKAAERCRVAQPSLSVQVAQLEEALGVALFERDKRHVLLTAAGRALVEYARRTLRDADDLATAARSLGDPFAGTIRVGVIPTVSPYLLPGVTPALRAKYPRLTVIWVEDRTPVLAASLDDGSLDAALLALEADIGDVEHEVITRDDFVLATPPGHALGAKSGPVSVSELKGQDVLLLDDGHCLRDQALEVCSRARAREMEFRATSLPTLVQMVSGGVGVTLLPELSLATETKRSELCVRPFAAPPPHRTVALAWRKRSPLATALRQVAVTIREHAARDGAPVKSPTRPRR